MRGLAQTLVEEGSLGGYIAFREIFNGFHWL